MKAFRFVALGFVLVSTHAMAGDKLIGKIVTTGANVVRSNGSTATPFVIPQSQKISIQCDQATVVITDTTTTLTPTTGVRLQAEAFFQTSTGGMTQIVIGGQVSAVLQVVSTAAAVTCNVFTTQL